MNQRKIGILISYLNIVLHAVIGFAYVPILLHYIGKSEYGLYQLIGSFIAYFSVMDFGLTAAVVRFYTKYKTLKDTVNMENILAIALRGYLIISIILFMLGCCFYEFLPEMFAKSMTVDEIALARKLFVLLLFNMVVTISTMIFRAVINAHECFLFLKGLETIQLVVQPILVVLVLQSMPTALSVAGIQTLLNVFLILSRMYYCFFKLKVKIRYHFFNKELLFSFKKLALSIFAVSIIDQLFFKTNQVILGIVSGTSDVAVYSLASLIYMNYMALSLAISGVYLPYVTELIAKNEPIAKLSDLFIKIGRLQYFVLALVASGFIVFGRQFIYIWAGESFDEAYYITLLIIIPFTIDLIQNIGNTILQAVNKYNYRAKVFAIMGILNLLIAIPLAIKFGGIGCAFATGISMLLVNGLIMNKYYMNVIGLDIIRFWREITKISFPIIILTIIALALEKSHYSDSGIRLFEKIMIYTFLYIVIVYKFAINTDEKKELMRFFHR